MGVAIVGMHRSGTSAVGRVLASLGLSIGGGERLVAQPENPRGYFERYDVAAINDRWLESLGGAWWAPPLTHEGTWGQLDTQQIRRDRTSLDLFRADQPAWLVKDPRLCLLMPLWDRMALTRLPAVLVVRDPREVAGSLMLRDGLSGRRALVLWYAYVHRAAMAMSQRDVLVVSHEQSLQDPLGTTKALAGFVAPLTGVDATGTQVDAAADLIEPALQRQRRIDPDGVALEHVEDCLELYRVVAAAHGTSSVPEVPTVVPRWVTSALEELSELWSLTTELEAVRRERDDLAGAAAASWPRRMAAYRRRLG